MIVPAKYYHDVYLLLVAALSVVAFIKYSWIPADSNDKSNNSIKGIDLVVLVFMVLFIAFRNPYSPLFGDTKAYTWFFEHVEFYNGYEYVWDKDAINLLFENLFHYMAFNYKSVSSFFFVISVIYFVGMWYASKKLFPKDSFAVFMVFLAAFSTFSAGINGIKAGAAASLFLVALALNNSDSTPKIFAYIFLVLSLGFHHSMKVPIAAFIICKIVTKPQIFTLLWIICFFIAALHITFFQELFADFGESLGDNKVVGYLSGESNQISQLGLSGFRFDFILYSVVPIVIGWITIYGKQIKSSKYIFLLNLYTLVNSIWLLCMYAWFTNRIAYLSWFMYPIVLIYPFLGTNWGDNKYKLFKVVAYSHLVFTLFMHFVYYS